MIKIAGAVKMSFIFPASLPVTYAYYSDLNTILHYLPHISVVNAYADDHFRMLYSSTEFGGYQMDIYCDIRSMLEGGRRMIHIVPEESLPPIEAKAGLNSSMARGYFTSRSFFFDEGAETRVEYEIQLKADLPTPMGMRLIPGRVHNQIAKTVARHRMREVAEGFIDRSAEAFPTWKGTHAERLEKLVAQYE